MFANFTPIPSSAGGLLLGASSSLLLGLTGKLAGLSSIFEGIFLYDEKSVSWKSQFASGMILGSIGACALLKPVASAIIVTWPAHVLSGLLVGFGTRLANGCTSGHGVCGLSSLRPRSLLAVCCFMLCGMGTASLELFRDLPTYIPPDNMLQLSLPLLSAAALLVLAGKPKPFTQPSIISGALFGFGLAISGMCSNEKVLNFLNVSRPLSWDPSLMCVMGGAVALGLVCFQSIYKYLTKPIVESCEFDLPKKTTIMDPQLICGSCIFGIGWGLSGLCPGPAVLCALNPMLQTSNESWMRLAFAFMPSMIAGMWIAKKVKEEKPVEKKT